MVLSSHSPQKHGHTIAKCKALCLVPSCMELMPLIPAAIPVVHPLSQHKCSISSTQRRMEQRIKTILRLIYPNPWLTSQGPLPSLSTLSRALKLHPLSYHPFIHRTVLPPVARGLRHLPPFPHQSIPTQLSDTTFLWAL
jgi:hypothetical protein